MSHDDRNASVRQGCQYRCNFLRGADEIDNLRLDPGWIPEVQRPGHQWYEKSNCRMVPRSKPNPLPLEDVDKEFALVFFSLHREMD